MDAVAAGKTLPGLAAESSPQVRAVREAGEDAEIVSLVAC